MLKTVLAFCLLVITSSTVQADETSVAKSLQSRVKAFHADAPKEELKLRVIYFHAADREPLSDYQDRLHRIVSDIKRFYDTEFTRIGLTDIELPIEMESGKLKLHTVKGLENHDGYDYKSGQKILREITANLKGVIDPEREFLLVLCGLCDKREDGSYFFYSPYYGMGANQTRGICFAADCEMLDTRNYKKTEEWFRYDEHNGKHRRTLGDFNNLYIGGTAHELGHGLSLPHNRELPTEKRKLGTALMGSGNYTFRKELVGGKGSFMTLASATRLMCHPLFTQSNKSRFDRTTIDVSDIEFTSSGKALTVRGKVQSNIEPFAVIGYSDAEGGDNYDAYQWTSEVAPDGTFEVTLDVHKPGNNALRLSFCHVNGATSNASYAFTANQQGEPNIQVLKDNMAIASLEKEMLSGNILQAREFAQRYLQANPQTELKPMFDYVDAFHTNPKLVKLAQVTQNEVFLSDAEATSTKVGYGRPTRNSYVPIKSRQDGGFFLRPGGQFHAHGFYAHAPSRFTFDLNGEWKKFTAVVGMQGGAWGTASAIFIVKGDGKELFRSDKLRTTHVENLDIDVSGIKQLELITETGESNNSGCWSVWGSPKLSR
ncbi:MULTISPECIES: NPCBM/NEW2 domain-containing protein [Pirellulaceae]|nr:MULTISPECIES: NPCBM/NEW2 domain-containing protein [Pirellulaceae]